MLWNGPLPRRDSGWSDSASGREAFRWTSDGGMVGLGDLPGGEFTSYATGVSGDGIAVLGLALPTLLRRRHKHLGVLRDTGEKKF